MDHTTLPLKKPTPPNGKNTGFTSRAPVIDAIFGENIQRISTTLGALKSIKDGIYYSPGAKVFVDPFPDKLEILVTSPVIIRAFIGKQTYLDPTRPPSKEDYLMLTLQHARSGAFSAQVQIELAVEDAAKLMKEIGVGKAEGLEGKSVFGYSLGHLTLGISVQLPQPVNERINYTEE